MHVGDAVLGALQSRPMGARHSHSQNGFVFESSKCMHVKVTSFTPLGINIIKNDFHYYNSQSIKYSAIYCIKALTHKNGLQIAGSCLGKIIMTTIIASGRLLSD